MPIQLEDSRAGTRAVRFVLRDYLKFPCHFLAGMYILFSGSGRGISERYEMKNRKFKKKYLCNQKTMGIKMVRIYGSTKKIK